MLQNPLPNTKMFYFNTLSLTKGQAEILFLVNNVTP